ncbi:NAD(P)H-dependent oxidoreductase [Flavobacterium geliluteum]|uniref:NAD(P)H-dependent oxidoreductase n=1 Tax=Flavobacterium geliluteum TaxID=2816120 RepID=A0A940X9W5_9FLAO|nr:NAD(P)H-dependent oxidoreductase [Flavobacterium geliluteum]MBP4138362.1 NAD(P)H-dependent oxidoreductase [Flavobacterium geliluteum]
MKLIEALNWRYATKKFSTKKVSNEKVHEIIEAINLSASSVGMQTYRVLVIENQELRKELGKDSFNAQIIEASHLLVFAAFETVTEEMIDNYIQFVANERDMSVDDLVDFKTAIKGGILHRTDEEHFTWSAKQAYIGLGTGLIAAANLEVDSTPMEGFDTEKFDSILGLKEKGLKSVVLLALGYRDAENDYMVNLKKVRLPLSEFAIEIS